ncbi:hypothetical protein SCA6_002151 [Theobroma cacao]
MLPFVSLLSMSSLLTLVEQSRGSHVHHVKLDGGSSKQELYLSKASYTFAISDSSFAIPPDYDIWSEVRYCISEPFNLTKEREKGYFDVDGNFVEFVNNNEIKDAWLDNIEDDIKYIGKTSETTNVAVFTHIC